MSIVLEMEEDGQLRIRVDRPGVSAVSDVTDPIAHIVKVCEAADLAHELIQDELTIVVPATEAPEGQGSGAAGSVEAPDA